MKPIDYVANLNAYYQGHGFPPYKWSCVPHHDLEARSRSRSDQAKVALLCSSGCPAGTRNLSTPWPEAS